MLEKIKLYYSFFWRMFVFSLLSWIISSAMAHLTLSFFGEVRQDSLMLTSGPYFAISFIICVFWFYFFLFLWKQRCPTHKMPFCPKIRTLKENQIPFHWPTQYKESIYETLKKEIWAYAIWCIFPTITCASAWCIGYGPQMFTAFPNSAFFTYGISLFKVQHFFFDLFYPLGIFSVPLGLLVGGALFVFAYSFIITLMKKNIYYGLKEKKSRSRLIKIIIFALLAVAIICVLAIILPVMYEQY